MKTKVAIKDAVVISTDAFDFVNDYWADFCEQCKAERKITTCQDCKPRVLPPTRWRKGE